MSGYHYITLLPAILSGLIALGMVLLGLRSRRRRVGILLAAFATALLATMVRHILGRLTDDPAMYQRWDRPLMAVFQLSLPAVVHLIHVMAGLRRGRWLYRGLYAAVAVAAPFTALGNLTVVGTRHAPSGLISQPGIGMYVLAGLSLLGAAFLLPLLLRIQAGSSQDDRHQKALVWGILGCLLLCFGDLIAGVGRLPLPPGVFCFIPLAAVTWSLLQADLSSTRREVFRRGAANDLAFAVLLVAVAVLLASLPGLFADQSAEEILDRFFPNALPATLSTLVCLAIAFATFAKGASNLGTLLFGVSTALWGFHTADFALIATLESHDTALWVNRIEHLGLVMNIPLTFHVCVAVAGAHGYRWLIHLAYALAGITLPFVLTDLYIPYMHHYWFGWFAHTGPVLTGYLALTVPLVAFGIYLLWRTSREAADERRRNLARYMATAFAGAFLLLLGTIPGIFGIQLYPPAQFLFVPFVLAASGILMTRAIAFRTFLRVGLVRVLAMVVLSLVYALAIVMVADATAGARRWATVAVIALVTAVAFVPVVRHVWDLLSDTLVSGATETDIRLRALCRRLASEPNPEESAKSIAREVTQTLECEAALALVGEGKAARLSGCRVVGGAATPVLVWADDPTLKAVIATAADNPRPDIPAESAGVLFDLVPDLTLVAPITYQQELVGMVAVGQRADGRPHDQDAWEWLEDLCERAAPYLRIHLYYATESPDAMNGIALSDREAHAESDETSAL